MELLGAQPGRKVLVYFVVTILIGAAALHLPAAAAGKPVSLVDALFTATSAVCVTGLIVVDTEHDFSRFGQVIIMILIQLGGLGIMTFATGLLVMAGARVAFPDRLGFTQSLHSGSSITPTSLLLAVAVTTLVIELAGAILLFFQFLGPFGPGDAAFHAVFHSVSAFCNAGFSTFSNSLEGYSGNSLLLLTFAGLIILGGLGFSVFVDISERLVGNKQRFSLHTKLCLAVTAVLIIAGTVVFWLLESGRAFAGEGPVNRLVNAFFQSVTCRTAGFNAVPQRSLTEVSLLVSMILMFIGGCPGSTAGGIKTTTFGTVVLTMWGRFRGRRSVAAFHRSIASDSIFRAVTVVLLAILVIVISFVLLMGTGDRAVQHFLSHGWFLDNLFEIVSAFGTVGLSLGMTENLNTTGKLIIIVTMFVGRVGLLTLAFSLARPRRRGEIVYAEEQVMIG